MAASVLAAAQGTGSTSANMALAQGALKLMAWAKLKSALTVAGGLAVLVVSWHPAAVVVILTATGTGLLTAILDGSSLVSALVARGSAIVALLVLGAVIISAVFGPGRVTWPDSEKMPKPLDFSVPIEANQSAPLATIEGTLAIDSTLLMTVGPP